MWITIDVNKSMTLLIQELFMYTCAHIPSDTIPQFTVVTRKQKTKMQIKILRLKKKFEIITKRCVFNRCIYFVRCVKASNILCKLNTQAPIIT